jgi:hypothetical protein
MDFWSNHGMFGGLFFLFFLVTFPRLTLAFLALISGAIGITILGIIGWIFLPRIVVAWIATTVYWDTNPLLCILSWIVALGGETIEKKVFTDKSQRLSTN